MLNLSYDLLGWKHHRNCFFFSIFFVFVFLSHALVRRSGTDIKKRKRKSTCARKRITIFKISGHMSSLRIILQSLINALCRVSLYLDVRFDVTENNRERAVWSWKIDDRSATSLNARDEYRSERTCGLDSCEHRQKWTTLCRCPTRSATRVPLTSSWTR